MRWAKALEAYGDLKKACDALINALLMPQHTDDIVLAQYLLHLQTDRQGLLVGPEEYARWKEGVMKVRKVRRLASQVLGGRPGRGGGKGAWRGLCELHEATLLD